MVFADRYLEGVPVPYVVSDNEMAAIKAVQHLSSLGHMNIALVSSLPTTTAIRQRSDGFYKSYTMVETPLQSRFVIDDIAVSYTHLLVSYAQDVFVSCSNHDKGAQLRQFCNIGCIGCRLCVKACPTGAIAVDDNLAHIDYAPVSYTHLYVLDSQICCHKKEKSISK